MSALETQMPPVQRAQVNGIEMAYYEAGPRQGVPIVLCHGFPELPFPGAIRSRRWARPATG